ncbi:hypothetical protein [Actinospongicola halichondriae]|uniref:hypothetical protein n=1 Tax=Actinospongicola halichondriae TaxID=3236844 RepID=UPI003D4A00E5
MSDQFGPTGEDDPIGAVPPPPPPPQQPIESILTLESESEVTSSSGFGGRAVAGIVGVLLLVGGTVFAVTQLGSSGPGSAEEAVADLIDAASDEDMLGMMAALDPGERDALRGPVEDMFGELERLEVLDDSFDLAGVNGLDLEFADVTYRTEPVREGLARVYLTGGTVTTSIDSDQLPIGDFISDTVERFGGEIGGFRDSTSSEINDEDVFLVARDGGDGWRVSIGYTVAEVARLEAGQPLPTAPIEPVGADSPEAAVQGMVDALADLDLRDAVARLSPNEFAALQDYADLFLAEAQAEADAMSEDFELTIDDLELRSDTSGDTATVFVDSGALTFSADGEEFSASFDDECFTIEGDIDGFEDSPFADGPVCADDLEDLSNEMFGGGFDFGLGDEMDADPIEFPEIDTPEIGITTQRVDGKWFVAPVATGLDATVSGLEVLERSHLDAIVDMVEQLFLGFEQSFEDGFSDFEEFEDFGEPIDGETFPTTTYVPGTQGGFIDEEALNEFLLAFTGDQETAACMRAELTLVDPWIVAELVDSYTFDYEPSPEAQDAFFAAGDVCF